MKTIIIFLILTAFGFSQNIQSQHLSVVKKRVSSGGSYVQISEVGDSTGSTWDPPFLADKWSYAGSTITPSTERYLDRVDWHIASCNESSTDSFVCQIWGLGGSSVLTTLIATSGLRVGFVANSWNTFIFSSQVTLPQDSALAILFRKEPIGISNIAGNWTQGNDEWSTGENQVQVLWDELKAVEEQYDADTWTIRWYAIE